MKKLLISAAVVGTLLVPGVAYAQTTGTDKPDNTNRVKKATEPREKDPTRLEGRVKNHVEREKDPSRNEGRVKPAKTPEEKDPSRLEGRVKNTVPKVKNL